MSNKRFDKESIEDLFFEKDVPEDPREPVDYIDPPKDLKHLVFGVIEEAYELISMIKDQIANGHFETEDQRTSLFDSASTLIANLNNTISTLIRRENNLMQDDRERKKIVVLEKQMAINAKIAGIELPDATGRDAIEGQDTFYIGKLSDLVNEIKSIDNKETIDIT